MRDATNKAARIVINHCIDHKIGTVVFGWNVGQKDSINLGSKTNQKFVQVPTARLKNRIAQLCEQYGIKFVETEESYTSKTSFLDNDVLPTFGAKPEWYNLEDCKYLVDMVKKIVETPSYSTQKSLETWSTYSNFYNAFDKLLEVLVETKMPREQVEEMGVIIFSNMQVNNNKDREFASLYEAIKTKYEEVGIKALQRPYKMPHIIFWNLESSDGFPALSIHPGVSMISGYNPKMLNMFCEKVDVCSPCGTSTPYTKLKELLNSKRYKCMEDELKKNLYK
jgi:IS605 OrfB family transposase